MSAKEDLINYVVKNGQGAINPNIVSQLADNIAGSSGSGPVIINFSLQDEVLTCDKTPMEVFNIMKSNVVIGLIDLEGTVVPLGPALSTVESGFGAMFAFHDEEIKVLIYGSFSEGWMVNFQ